MKVAIITTHPIQYYSPVYKLLNARQGIEIKVFYTWGEAAIKKFDPGFNKVVDWDIDLLEGYPYEWVENTSKNPGSHSYKGIVTPGLIQQILNYNPDKILVYGWAYHGHLQIIRHFKNKLPVYFRGDSTLLDNSGGIKSFLRLVFLKWVYKHIYKAFYVGANNKAYFLKYGFSESQLLFAPHAVDNQRFAVDHSTGANEIKAKLNIPAEAMVILFAGKLEQKKDPSILLKAFFNIVIPDTHLLFAGDGELQPELKLLSSQHANIHFLGFQNQSAIPAVYQACDLFCLPSLGPGETWGLAVNEAMACKKAVLVSTKVGCAIDLVIPEKNGDIFEAGNVKDLTEKLQKLLNKGKSGLSAMGESSAEMIKHWDFISQVNAFEKGLNEK